MKHSLSADTKGILKDAESVPLDKEEYFAGATRLGKDRPIITWIALWKKVTNAADFSPSCFAEDCGALADKGAHNWRWDGVQHKWDKTKCYIVPHRPTCHKHNGPDFEYPLCFKAKRNPTLKVMSMIPHRWHGECE